MMCNPTILAKRDPPATAGGTDLVTGLDSRTHPLPQGGTDLTALRCLTDDPPDTPGASPRSPVPTHNRIPLTMRYREHFVGGL